MSTALKVNLGTYGFNILNTGKITHVELFMNAHTKEINKPEQFRTYTKQLHVILDSK